MSSARPSSDNENQERISTVAALLNSSLLAGSAQVSVNPSRVGILGAAGARCGRGRFRTIARDQAAPKRRDRSLSTLGIVLLIAAFPFRYSGTRLSVLWLAEAEALLLIGVWTKEIIFRRTGDDRLRARRRAKCSRIRRRGNFRTPHGWRRPARRLPAGHLLFVVAAAVFYANAQWVFPRWPNLFAHEVDRRVMQRLSYAGMFMMLVAAWIAFPEAWTAVVWCGLALALAVAARRLAAHELAYQAIFLSVAAVVRVLTINLDATDKFHGVTLRLITIASRRRLYSI